MNKQNLTSRNVKEFNFLAKYYDSSIFSWFFKNSYKKVKKQLGDIQGKNILSIACGTGTLEINLARLNSNAKIVGFDLSQEMLRIAQEKIGDLKNIQFSEGNVENLPFPDQSFDKIVCVHAFHHFSDSEKALKEMQRVLVANGTLLIFDAVKETFLGKLFIFIVENFIEPGVKHFSKEEWMKLLQESGYKNVEIQKVNSFHAFFMGTKI